MPNLVVYYVGDYQDLTYNRKSQNIPRSRRRRKHHRYNDELIDKSNAENDKAPWSNKYRKFDKRRKRKRWPKREKFIKVTRS